MDIQPIRDKVAGFLILREIAQLRNTNRYFRNTELVLNLYSVPRKVKLFILWFLSDLNGEEDSDEESEETSCERLALVNRGCWDTCRSGTRNYSRLA